MYFLLLFWDTLKWVDEDVTSDRGVDSQPRTEETQSLLLEVEVDERETQNLEDKFCSPNRPGCPRGFKKY